ncbi:MAG: hypothetical protein ABJN35_09275 [Erythrobacter sp.]
MKKSAAILGTASLALSGCFAPPEPIVLSDDLIEAARTCFVAQGMVLREGKSEGDAVSYTELAESMKYALAAAAQTEPFSTETVSAVLNGTSDIIDQVGQQDYAGAIADCDARFGTNEPVSLPEEDAQAVLSCLTLSAFLQGAAESQAAEFGDDGASVVALFERLEARMETDPDVLVLLIGSDGDEVMSSATQTAFSAGSPQEFINQCAARFPAE